MSVEMVTTYAANFLSNQDNHQWFHIRMYMYVYSTRISLKRKFFISFSNIFLLTDMKSFCSLWMLTITLEIHTIELSALKKNKKKKRNCWQEMSRISLTLVIHKQTIKLRKKNKRRENIVFCYCVADIYLIVNMITNCW